MLVSIVIFDSLSLIRQKEVVIASSFIVQLYFKNENVVVIESKKCICKYMYIIACNIVRYN